MVFYQLYITPEIKYLAFVIPANFGIMLYYWMPDYPYLVAGLIRPGERSDSKILVTLDHFSHFTLNIFTPPAESRFPRRVPDRLRET